MDSLHHISTRCFTAKVTAGHLLINLKPKGGRAMQVSEAAKLWREANGVFTLMISEISIPQVKISSILKTFDMSDVTSPANFPTCSDH